MVLVWEIGGWGGALSPALGIIVIAVGNFVSVLGRLVFYVASGSFFLVARGLLEGCGCGYRKGSRRRRMAFLLKQWASTFEVFTSPGC